MKRINTLLIILTSFIFSNQISFSQSITWIDSSAFPFSQAYDVSDDGNTVVGEYSVSQPYSHPQAFRWKRNQGFIDLGTLAGLNTHAYGVSGDGTIIVGNAQDNIINVIGRAFFWTDTTGIVDIGTLGGDCAIAHDISGDGKIIVGESEDGYYGILMAFRRLQNGVMDNLGSFCNGCISRANAVSYDGSVIVGYAEYGTYHNAFRWTPNLGLQDLGRLGGYQSEANGVSEDGSIVVGRTDVNHPNGTRGHAFKWTITNGMVDIHNDNVGSAFSTAYSVSADGKKIVGTIDLGGNLHRAFLWTEEDGMKKLEQVFSNIITYGSELRTANKITPDGRFIIGSGYNSATGKSSAYIIDTQSAVNIEDENGSIFSPAEFKLFQNYPNPFNPSTKISWQSPVGSWQTIKVFDVLGNEVATLVNEFKPAGGYEVEFNGQNLSSGVYFYQLRAGDFIQTKKMILLR
ncbi:MAG: hypothetical protein KatS3mg036_0352 [Ignavibacterium sp.]|nr:MAG: hypothetical protein KatS3mg036_0352 [Ignavibacterium sp.]